MGSGAGWVLLLLSVSPGPSPFFCLWCSTPRKANEPNLLSFWYIPLCSWSNLHNFQKSFHCSVCVVDGEGGKVGGGTLFNYLEGVFFIILFLFSCTLLKENRLKQGLRTHQGLSFKNSVTEWTLNEMFHKQTKQMKTKMVLSSNNNICIFLAKNFKNQNFQLNF